MKNNKTCFFYVLYSDKTWVFDQSEACRVLSIIIVNNNHTHPTPPLKNLLHVNQFHSTPQLKNFTENFCELAQM